MLVPYLNYRRAVAYTSKVRNKRRRVVLLFFVLFLVSSLRLHCLPFECCVRDSYATLTIHMIQRNARVDIRIVWVLVTRVNRP